MFSPSVEGLAKKCTFTGRPETGKCSILTHTATDIDDQAASLSGWDQRYDQLSPGKYEGSVTECWIDDFQVVHERSNQSMHQMGYAWKGSRTFVVPIRQKGTARFGMRVVDAGCPVTLAPEQELDFRTPKNLDVISVVVNADAISRYSMLTEGFELEAKLSKCGWISNQSSGLGALQNMLESLNDLIMDSHTALEHSSMRKHIRESLFSGLIDTFTNSQLSIPKPRALAHAKIVKKAREYVLENTIEPVTIAELCESIGVSRRALQMCFQEVMGTNPVQYLRAIRLNRVRRDLRLNEGGKLKVQDVACLWGFWHLSSFTADYKKMFGELPSQTLARSISSIS